MKKKKKKNPYAQRTKEVFSKEKNIKNMIKVLKKAAKMKKRASDDVMNTAFKQGYAHELSKIATQLQQKKSPTQLEDPNKLKEYYDRKLSANKATGASATISRAGENTQRILAKNFRGKSE